MAFWLGSSWMNHSFRTTCTPRSDVPSAEHTQKITQPLAQCKMHVCLQYTGSLPDEHNAITVDIIKPATEKHIQKYSAQETVLVSAR